MFLAGENSGPGQDSVMVEILAQANTISKVVCIPLDFQQQRAQLQAAGVWTEYCAPYCASEGWSFLLRPLLLSIFRFHFHFTSSPFILHSSSFIFILHLIHKCFTLHLFTFPMIHNFKNVYLCLQAFTNARLRLLFHIKSEEFFSSIQHQHRLLEGLLF